MINLVLLFLHLLYWTTFSISSFSFLHLTNEKKRNEKVKELS